MGCGASKEELAAFQQMGQRCDELELEKLRLEEFIEELEKKIRSNEEKNKEQLNLYRFKIEVMTNMLSVEEKKLESTVKRLETLKLAMLTQGFTDKAMNNLLRTKNVPGNDKDDERNILMTSAFDLSGAIERLNKEMEQGHAEDIICAFANKQGKLVSHISRDDFARYLYNVTETLTKSDVQVLSLRFYDGSTVCVPEFIEFFTSSSSSRVAKAAASAVRVSLNMLQLEDDKSEENTTEVEEIHELKSPSTNMKNLQHSVDKLVAVWEEVEEPLIEEFVSIDEEVGGNQIVQLETFEEVLDVYCGEFKARDDRKHRRASGHKWLTGEEINLIACRFEIGDRIDVKQFFNFFQDAYYSNNPAVPAASPFQFSKEWSTLKHDAQKELVTKRKQDSAGAHENIPTIKDLKESILNKPKQNVEKADTVKVQNVPQKRIIDKPTVVKASIERDNVEPKKPPISSNQKSASFKKEETQDEPSPVSSPKKFDNTLVALYARDPDDFQNSLEKMSAKTGFIMTKDEFHVVLVTHTAKENVAEEDIDNVLSSLKYIGGTCSVSDLVDYLAGLIETMQADMKPKSSSLDTKPGSKERRQDLLQGPLINVRQQHIEEMIASLKVAKLDIISTEYNADPKVFTTKLKTHTVNKKTGVVDGTGNAITSASFNQVLRDVVPNAPRGEVDTLEQELQLTVRKDTNSILVASIISTLKKRIKEFNATDSNIKKQEKLLQEEEKRNVRIAEKIEKVKELTLQIKPDNIADYYGADPKFFMSNLKSGKTEKTLLMSDLLTHFDKNVPNITAAENKKFKADMIEANKKLNEKDENPQVAYAAVEKLIKQRISAQNKLTKEIEKEKKLLQKDIDKASTIEDTGGGCCGGGGSNVHDPNNAPQDLPLNSTGKSGKLDHSTHNQHHNENEKDNDLVKDLDKDLPPQNQSVPDDFKGSDEFDGLPKRNPRRLKPSTTTDTLTYSENGDDKSDDSGMIDHRSFNKSADRKPLSHSRESSRSSLRDFGRPREVDDKTPSDYSDDDSLIFKSMGKK